MPKQRKIVPKRTKVDKKTYIAISILGTTSGGGAEKDNCSAETEKIGAENAKIQSAEKSAETGGSRIQNKKKQEIVYVIFKKKFNSQLII